MIAKVEIELSDAVGKRDKEHLYQAAAMITDNVESITIKEPSKAGKQVEVEFSIKKIRQDAIVDSIGKAFRKTVGSCTNISISFSNKQWGKGKQRKFTQKQGQYLAFIYYYTKIQGVAPAETDLQKYFKVSPPSVHRMLVTLEKNGLIKRTPKQARSIELLVSRREIPDLV